MDICYDFRFSLEETDAEIAKLQEYVGTSEVPFAEDETVGQLQHAMQHRVAFAASELMTGMRWHSERQQYLDAYAVYRRLLGAVALDTANRKYDECEDAHKVMQATGGYLNESKLQMVALDFEKRLERSPLEQMKQKVAQNDKLQFALPITLTSSVGAMGFLATTALLKTSEAQPLSTIELTPTVGGVASAATAVGLLAVRSALRSGSRQMGSILGSQVNASILPYLEKFDEEEGEEKEEISKDLEYLIGRYALRHLKSHSAELGSYFHNFDFNSRDDIVPMVEGALDVTEAEMHKSYGVDPKREWPGPWYLSLPSRLFRVNLAAN